MNSRSTIVKWSEAYKIGLPEIDDQHMTLVDLMNDLWATIAANAPIEDSEKILERLELYTIAHFTAEETMMQAIGYPEFSRHQGFHRQFVDRLKAEKARLRKGEKLSLDILHFLRDWLLNHILVNDKAYAEYCAKQNRPSGFLGRFFSRLMAA